MRDARLINMYKKKEISTHFFPKKVAIRLWHVIVVPVIMALRIPTPVTSKQRVTKYTRAASRLRQRLRL